MLFEQHELTDIELNSGAFKRFSSTYHVSDAIRTLSVTTQWNVLAGYEEKWHKYLMLLSFFSLAMQILCFICSSFLWIGFGFIEFLPEIIYLSWSKFSEVSTSLQIQESKAWKCQNSMLLTEANIWLISISLISKLPF